VCDLAYIIRAEQIRQNAIADYQLAPHREDNSHVLTADGAVAEFDEWLLERPKELDQNPDDLELRDLMMGKVV
jgi:hypothetical protein